MKLFSVRRRSLMQPPSHYSKYPSCITRDFIAEKLLSMEVRGFCHALKYLPTDYNHDHFKRLCDLYLTEPGVVDSSISQEFRSMLNKETSEKVRLEMLDTLREVCSRLQDISEKLVVSSCIFSHAIVTLCSFRDSTASIEGSISAARNFLEVFERLDHSNSNWIDVLKTKQAILSDGRRVSLLDFFLNSCYIAGNIASLLIKGYDNWSSSKKAQSHSYYKLLLSFCIVSWRMLVPLVISSLAGEKSKSLPNDPGHSTCGLSSTVLRFISSAHHHLSLYNLCDAADGEFLLGEITHIKSFGSRNDTDDEREELNQCYRCLYGVYLKDIQTEDHQTSRQQLTEAAALDLFLRISRAIDDENIHISKLMFQDYAELLVRIGEVLEKNISCKKSILSYNASVLERLLSRPQSYCCPLSRLKLSFLKFPLDRLESEELAEFCEKFYYVSGRAAKGQSVCRRGPVQLVNPEKTASILDLAIRKFNKGLCVSFDNWRVWMHLGNCYAALENEYLGRSASYVVKNWSSIDKFRRRAFNSFVVALQLCNDSISRISEENSKRELLDDAGKIWGFLGELCYNIYDLPSIYPVRTRTRNSIERTRRVTRRMLELKLKNFGNMYEGASGNGGSAHFGLSIERDTVDKNEPASYLYEKTTSAVRMEEQNYHTLKRLIREDEVEFDERRLEIEEAPSFKLEDPDHAAAFSALENCYPFTRSGEILKFAAFALKRALALSKSARKNWLYHMLLGSASYIIGASNELSIDYYITSILLSSKEVLAKEQETILEPYIELIKFVCMSYITKRMSLHELEGLKEALSETDDRVFQMSRPIRKPGEYKTQGFIEPFIANSDLLEPKGTSAVVGDDVSNCNNSTGTFDFLNELVLRVRSEDKKGWHHEHSSLTYILYYFVKRDIEAAKDGFKVLLRLHGGKSKGFLNIWRTDYERPGNLFLCTHKYILFSLMLFKSTQDIKSLRRLIKKLCKSADKLLWPDLIAEKSSNACIECLESVLEKKIPKNYVLCEHEYSKTTSNSQIIGNLSSAIAEIITPDINHLLEALCLSFEINEYLRIGSENKLAHLQLQIYVYFVGSVIDEVNKRLHSNPGAPLVREETEASLNIIKDFFSKNEMENAVAQDSERQVLQFAKILIRPIATLVSKQPQCSGIDQVSAK